MDFLISKFEMWKLRLIWKIGEGVCFLFNNFYYISKFIVKSYSFFEFINFRKYELDVLRLCLFCKTFDYIL